MTKMPEKIDFSYIMKSKTDPAYIKWKKPAIDVQHYLLFRCLRVVTNQPEKLLSGELDAQLQKYVLDSNIEEIVDDTGDKESRYLVLAIDKEGNASNVELLHATTINKAKPLNPYYFSIKGFKSTAPAPVAQTPSVVKAKPAAPPPEVKVPKAEPVVHPIEKKEGVVWPEAVKFIYTYKKEWDDAYITWEPPADAITRYAIYKTKRAVSTNQLKQLFSGELAGSVQQFAPTRLVTTVIDDTGEHLPNYLVVGMDAAGNIFNVTNLKVDPLSSIVNPSPEAYYLSAPDGKSLKAKSVKRVELKLKSQEWYLNRLVWKKPDLKNLSHYQVSLAKQDIKGDMKRVKELIEGKDPMSKFFRVGLDFDGIIDNVSDRGNVYFGVLAVDTEGVKYSVDWTFIEPPFDWKLKMSFLDDATGKQKLESIANQLLEEARASSAGPGRGRGMGMFPGYSPAEIAKMVFIIVPDHPGATAFLNQIQQAKDAKEEESKQKRVKQFMDKAKAHLEGKKYDWAVQSLQSALDLDPENADIKQMFNKAKEQADLAKLFEATLREAKAAMEQDDPQRAIDKYKAALVKYPKNEQLETGLLKAERLLAIKVAGNDIEKLMALGKSYEAIDEDLSHSVYKKAYALDKKNVNAFKKAMEITISEGNGNEVLSEIEEIAQKNFSFLSYTGVSQTDFDTRITELKDLLDAWNDISNKRFEADKILTEIGFKMLDCDLNNEVGKKEHSRLFGEQNKQQDLVNSLQDQVYAAQARFNGKLKTLLLI